MHYYGVFGICAWTTLLCDLYHLCHRLAQILRCGGPRVALGQWSPSPPARRQAVGILTVDGHDLLRFALRRIGDLGMSPRSLRVSFVDSGGLDSALLTSYGLLYSSVRTCGWENPLILEIQRPLPP